MRARHGLLLALALGCSADLDASEQSVSEMRVTGPWRLPASTAAAGDRQHVPYVGSARIADGGRCTSTNAFACSCSHPACSRGLPGTLDFATFLRRRFPQITSAGGSGCCRQNTGNTAFLSVHSIGRALDLMIPTLGGDANNTAGDAVANWLVENAQRIGVQLVTWDRSTWNASRAPGTKLNPYTGPIPHVDHIHMELSLDAANRRTPFFTSGEINGGACAARCDGTRVVSADCSVGDCAAYGATCTAAPAPRCVSLGCPRTGAGFICLDRNRRAECRDGLIVATGDCGMFGAFCSVAGVAPTAARCTFSLCVSGPEAVPSAHTTCSITAGRLLECDANGGAREVPCPAGQVCSVAGGAARCTSPIPQCPVPTAGAPADDRTVCLGESTVARCYNGNVISATPCGENGICSSLSGSVHCAQRACVDGAGRLREGDVCAPLGVVIRCDATGSFQSVRPCPAGTTCLAYSDGARCAAVTADAGEADGGSLDDDLPPDESDGGAAATDAAVPTDVSEARDVLAPQDVAITQDGGAGADAVVGAGCGCRASIPGRHAGWLLGLAPLLRRRHRRARRSNSDAV